MLFCVHLRGVEILSAPFLKGMRLSNLSKLTLKLAT